MNLFIAWAVMGNRRGNREMRASALSLRPENKRAGYQTCWYPLNFFSLVDDRVQIASRAPKVSRVPSLALYRRQFFAPPRDAPFNLPDTTSILDVDSRGSSRFYRNIYYTAVEYECVDIVSRTIFFNSLAAADL